LFRDGGALFALESNGRLLLVWTDLDGGPRLRLQTNGLPAFAWDLPGGTFRERLATVIKMRRLLPLAELETTGRELAILDGYEKTVARVVLERSTVVGPTRPKPDAPMSTLMVAPLRGYAAAYNRVCRHAERELGLRPLAASALELALTATGRRPGDYSSKLALSLHRQTRADDATRTVLRRLFEILLANEDGTRRDLDSEFLHDFRVAVRRTRSALGQIKRVLPQQQLQRFREEFAWLGGLTGPTRDLDVLLLTLRDHASGAPEGVESDLQPLHEFLRARHTREQRRLATALRSQRYRKLIREWRQFLERSDDDNAPANAGHPIIEVASQRIWRVWCRTLDRGLAIDDASPPSALHRLRIECKKLRYLMEFYRSLYDAQAIGEPIRALKGLQDLLGELNDLAIQREILRDSARQMSDRGVGGVDTFIAVGRLLERSAVRQVKQRRRFAERFAAFSAAENRSRIQRLFGPPEGES
jgi:CHAD domain-containing protein